MTITIKKKKNNGYIQHEINKINKAKIIDHEVLISKSLIMKPATHTPKIKANILVFELSTQSNTKHDAQIDLNE
jgi:hypothetical protein